MRALEHIYKRVWLRRVTCRPLSGRCDPVAQGFDAAAGLGDSATLAQFVSALVADQQQTRVSAQQREETLLASAASIEAVRSGVSGVNVDDELQKLLEIEQAYAANSRVIQTLTEMLDTLLAAF